MERRTGVDLGEVPERRPEGLLHDRRAQAPVADLPRREEKVRRPAELYWQSDRGEVDQIRRAHGGENNHDAYVARGGGLDGGDRAWIAAPGVRRVDGVRIVLFTVEYPVRIHEWGRRLDAISPTRRSGTGVRTNQKVVERRNVATRTRRYGLNMPLRLRSGVRSGVSSVGMVAVSE